MFSLFGGFTSTDSRLTRVCATLLLHRFCRAIGVAQLLVVGSIGCDDLAPEGRQCVQQGFPAPGNHTYTSFNLALWSVGQILRCRSDKVRLPWRKEALTGVSAIPFKL